MFLAEMLKDRDLQTHSRPYLWERVKEAKDKLYEIEASEGEYESSDDQ